MNIASSRSPWHIAAVCLLAIGLVAVASADVCGQATAPVAAVATGAIEGVVTTQSASVPLAGAVLTLREGDREAGTQASDEHGRFRFTNVPAGTYRLSVSLDGFDTATAAVNVTEKGTAESAFDLTIAAVVQRVDVVAPTHVDPVDEGQELKSDEMEQFSPGAGFETALRLLPSVLQVPGGISIKGGRASQISVQLGSTTLIDPSTGFTKISLPADAIESIEVMPNPYEVEFGRFSSGVIVLQPRRAGDRWKTRFNNFDPAFRLARNSNPFDVKGVASFGPRIETGGPLVKDRLFLEQTAQFQYLAATVNSLPESEFRTDEWVSTFTRIDGSLSPRHSIVATGGVYPRLAQQANLGTFMPPQTTVDLRSRASYGALTERALWNDALVGEASIERHNYRATDDPRGSAPMELLPDLPGADGSFFNRQERHTSTYQAVGSLSGSHATGAGLHLYKFGLDLLRNDFSGTSSSGSVRILRDDGTLARRLDFDGSASQSVGSTDVALFAQDRIQPTRRWYVELGTRIDRDGITEQWNLTPRVGTAVVLDRSGTAVLRGGFGVFYDRTPSTAGVFGEFENYTDTRFGADGMTPASPPVWFTHAVAPNLQTPRSATWDVAYDDRFSPAWSLHVGVLDRTGRHELVVDPTSTGASTGELLLASVGRSTYREAEIALHYTPNQRVDLNVSYVRSSSYADLNALTNFFDTLLWPVIGKNQYAPSNDVPNRLLTRGRVMPTSRWLLLGLFEWRSGLPYSVVDENLDFVGPRNDRRFPSYARTELGIERRFQILKLQPWIGLRVTNAFAAFLPVDVQANNSSPAFGTFYNSEYRQVRIQFRFEQ